MLSTWARQGLKNASNDFKKNWLFYLLFTAGVAGVILLLQWQLES